MITEQEGQEIEGFVKELIRKSISSKLTDTDIKERGIAKFDVVESYLTDVMALGYNNNSLELATDDIWEMQSQLTWVSITKLDIAKRVENTSLKFKPEIDCFKLMIKNINSGYDKATIIENAQKAFV